MASLANIFIWQLNDGITFFASGSYFAVPGASRIFLNYRAGLVSGFPNTQPAFLQRSFCMLEAIYLPKLKYLTPTLDSTLLKAMEEAGELARAVLNFMPWEKLSPAELKEQTEAIALLADVKEELLDVAQTCVTMIFVMEDSFGIDADSLIGEHLAKLADKGYAYDTSQNYRITTTPNRQDGNYKYISLPHLRLDNVTLLTTVCKIQEEIGELTQFLGKHAGASGEQARLDPDEVNRGAALELLDIAQCCFTMMYILAGRYAVNIAELVAGHVNKLQRRGYC